MFRDGYLRIGSVRGADLSVHVALLVALGLLGLFQRSPFGLLGLATLVFVHELGHAALAWSSGLHVRRVAIHLFGGSCGYEGHATELETITIAWGGVLAQLLLFGIAYGVARSGAPLPGEFLAVFLGWNLAMIVINLVPVAPLDGAVAWRIVPYAFRKLRRRATRDRRIAHDLTLRRSTPGPFREKLVARDDLVIDDAAYDALAERLRVARAAERGDDGSTPSLEQDRAP